jgi:spore coat protein U-like protein
MKKASAIAAAAGLLFGLVSVSSQAGTATGNFNVSINFTSACTVGGTLAPSFTYTSGQAAAAPAAGTLGYTVTCTNGVPYTMALDAGGGTYTGAWAAPTGTYTNTASTLIYTLTLPAAVAGTGAAQAYTLSGNMAGLQAGKCTTLGGCVFTDAHTLTVTF